MFTLLTYILVYSKLIKIGLINITYLSISKAYFLKNHNAGVLKHGQRGKA